MAQPKEPDHGPWWTWLVTRILAASLIMTLLAGAAFEIFYRYLR